MWKGNVCEQEGNGQVSSGLQVGVKFCLQPGRGNRRVQLHSATCPHPYYCQYNTTLTTFPRQFIASPKKQWGLKLTQTFTPPPGVTKTLLNHNHQEKRVFSPKKIPVKSFLPNNFQMNLASDSSNISLANLYQCSGGPLISLLSNLPMIK